MHCISGALYKRHCYFYGLVLTHSSPSWSIPLKFKFKINSSCIDGGVRLWDTRSSSCQEQQFGHVRGVLDFAPSPDFKSIVTASDDHTARVFRMVP